MAKIPWGLFDAKEVLNNDDTAWTKLNTIAKHLKDGNAIPFHLSIWLGKAIQDCKENPDALLKNLGIKKQKGGQKKYADRISYQYGEYLYHLKLDGLSPEDAINRILSESQDAHGDETKFRSSLQRWEKEYSDATHHIDCQNEAEKIIECQVKKMIEAAENQNISLDDIITYASQNHDDYFDKVLKDANYPEINIENLKKWVKSYKNHNKNPAHKS